MNDECESVSCSVWDRKSQLPLWGAIYCMIRSPILLSETKIWALIWDITLLLLHKRLVSIYVTVIILLNRWSAVRTSSFNMRKRTRHSTVFYRIQPRFYWDHYLWWVIIVILLKAYWNHAVEVRRQIEIAISVICITIAHQLHFFYVLPVEQRKLIELRDGQHKGPSVCVLLTAWKIYTVHGGTNLPNWLLYQNHLHSHAQGSETNYKVLTRGMESFTAEQPANKIPIWLDLQ